MPLLVLQGGDIESPAFEPSFHGIPEASHRRFRPTPKRG